MPTMSICRLLLPNKDELCFFHIHFYTLYKKCTSFISTFILYIKSVQACSFLTACLSTNIPWPHLLYNLVKVLQRVASCITSSGINRGSYVLNYLALDGAICAAKKLSLRWWWKVPHYTNLASGLSFHF